MLVGNKSDLSQAREVPTEEACMFAGEGRPFSVQLLHYSHIRAGGVCPPGASLLPVPLGTHEPPLLPCCETGFIRSCSQLIVRRMASTLQYSVRAPCGLLVAVSFTPLQHLASFWSVTRCRPRGKFLLHSLCMSRLYYPK